MKKFNRKIPQGKKKIKINVQKFIKIGNDYKDENENLKALHWYKKAAELNSYVGIYLLAEVWKEIYPDKKYSYIEDKISTWKNFAIANKNAKLLNLIGNFYYNGIIVEENLKKALEFYNSAAKLGNETAMIEIYLMYKEGRGVQKNKRQANFWYAKIKNKLPTLADDIYEIGYNYAINGFFNRNNSKYADSCYKTAMEYFKKAVSYGKVDAYEDIGKFYLRGHGVKKNLEKAMEYYSMSQNWFAIGEIYRIGKYLPQDKKKLKNFI